jgi:hypothetical protein
MRVLKLTLGKNIFSANFLQFQFFSVKHPNELILTSGRAQSVIPHILRHGTLNRI